jgi:hypothetical protein
VGGGVGTSLLLGGVHFYFPLAACLIVSVVGTILLNLFSRRR